MIQTAGGPTFGTLLREFRVAAGLSQEALAERATMSPDGIGALERGVNRAPQRETLALLMRALNLQPNQQAALEAAAARPSTPRVRLPRKNDRVHLPRPLSPLFGRQRELDDIAAFSESAQLVTLIGAGGVGKTRLAIEAARVAAARYADGVWFVDLAPIRDPDAVPAALGETFNVREGPSRTRLQGIVEALKRKHALILLDNCEQVAAGAASTIEAICAACPGIRILATSRQPLHVTGEQTYRVASLDADASLALFVDVGRRADASFSLTPAETAAAARIAARLDGIALAIELAASRVRFLSVDQIEQLLAERLRILSGSGRVARHQTMRALIDWSYDLLSDPERTLFERLAVFSGDFSLEAAVAVCADERLAESRIVDLLGSLVDKSLLTSTRSGRTRRFRLLETMREYAKEKLGARVSTLKRRHATYYYGVAKTMSMSAADWVGILETEYENVRSALEWSIDEGGDVAIGVRLLSEIKDYMLFRGLGAESARRAERALESEAALTASLRALAWEVLASMRGSLLLPAKSFDAAERSLALYETLDEPVGLARALRARGIAHLRMGKTTEANDDLQRSLALQRRHGDRRDVARTLGSVAVVYEVTGRLDEGRAAMLEVLDMARSAGDLRHVWVTLTNLAEVEFAIGEVSSAVGRLEELLASSMTRKNVRMRANVRANLSAYLFALGRDGEACSTARAAIFDARDAGDAGVMSCALGHVAAIVSRDDAASAARLLGYVESVFAAGYQREYTERYTYDRLMASLRAQLSQERIDILLREGANLSEDAAVSLAMHAGKSPTRARKRAEPLGPHI